jgi:transcriptional regulator with XRE-family HTH domain
MLYNKEKKELIKMLTFCTNLRKYRLDRGMSQQELADMVGYKSRSSVNKIEKGLTTVTLEQARKIANALNVELEDLVPEYRLIQAPDVSSHDEYKKKPMQLHDSNENEIYRYLYSRTDDVGRAFKQFVTAMLKEERFKAVSETDKNFLLDFRRLNTNNKKLILNMIETMLQAQKNTAQTGGEDLSTQKGTSSLKQVP